MRKPLHAYPMLAVATAFTLALLPACDSDSTGPGTGAPDGAVFVGSVSSSTGSAPEDGLASTAGSATFVTAGTLQADGTLEPLGEASVEVDGTFRIEGLPAGRAGLVVRAEADDRSEVGRVIVHQETRAEAETRVPPIDASTTLHARIVVATQGASFEPAASAMVALRFQLPASAAAGAAWSTDLSTVLAAEAETRATEEAVLATRGISLDAATHGPIVLEAMAEWEGNRFGGTSHDAAHRAFVDAVVRGLVQVEGEPEGFAAAYAAAASALDASLDGEDGALRLALLRNAMRLNLAARAATAAGLEGGTKGLDGVALEVLADLDARIEAAGDRAALRSALDTVRAGIEAEVITTVLEALGGLPVELLPDVEAELVATLSRARLWAGLESAASAEARAVAVTVWALELEAQVEEWIATLPPESAGEVDASAAFQAFVVLGAGPSLH